MATTSQQDGKKPERKGTERKNRRQEGRTKEREGETDLKIHSFIIWVSTCTWVTQEQWRLGGVCKFCCLNSDKNLLGHCIETQRVEVISIHGNLEVNANNRLRAGYPSVPLGAFQLFDQSICSEVRSYGNAIPPNTRECRNSDPESGPAGRNIHSGSVGENGRERDAGGQNAEISH